MNDLVQLIENASTAVFSTVVKTSDQKLQEQLWKAGMTLRKKASDLRVGAVTVPDAAVAICAKELGEVVQAANAANNGDGYARVLYEALQAIDTVNRHLVRAAALGATAANAYASTEMDALFDMPQGYTPLPPDVFPPRWPRWPLPPRNWPLPWPPRPFPPSPWPPGPPPWFDAGGWENGGY